MRTLRLLGLLVVAFWGMGVTRAKADARPAGDAPAAPPRLVPPRLLAHDPVTYPEGAEGEARVILQVVVNLDGSVRSVKVVDGAAPFAERAETAARSYRFTPAQRGDVAVAATLQLLVEFTPPAREPPPHETHAAPEITPKTAPAGTVEAVEEVRVQGARTPPTAVSLGRAEVREIPGAFGDPFRAIDVLPGVVPTLSGLPYYYIRGAPPSNVGYYVDGIRLPYLFHFALGPGVIQPSMLERVDLYPGGAPAGLGRYAGAYVVGETTAPRQELFGEANIRLVDAGAIAEAPFADGRGHVLVGGRYSYTGAVISLFAKDLTIDYRDYNARFTYDVTDKDRLTFFTLGAYDLAADMKNGVKRVLFGAEFYRGDVRWDRKWSDKTTSRVATTIGFDRTRIEGQRFSRDVPIGIRADVTHVVSREVTVRLGADAQFDSYDTDLPSPFSVSRKDYEETARFFAPRVDFATGLHGDVVLRLPHGIELTPGARVDAFGSRGDTAFAFDPRLSARVPLTSRLRLLFAHGLAHQPPAFPLPIPGIGVPGLRTGLQEVNGLSGGFEVDLPLQSKATVVGFRNAFRNVGDFFSTRGDGPFSQDPTAFRGRAFGLEVGWRRKLTQRIGALLSYTLSRNTRTSNGIEAPNAFDRTHVFNAVLSFDLGLGWRSSARFLYYSGSPRTESIASTLAGRTDHVRGPGFARIDARIEKRWHVGKKGWIALVLEGLNVTASKEVLADSCDAKGNCDNGFGPVVVPSIGVEGGL